MKHIQLVESDDLEFSYFHLVNRLPDKNHKTDLESEGSGIESSLFILVLYWIRISLHIKIKLQKNFLIVSIPVLCTLFSLLGIVTFFL